MTKVYSHWDHPKYKTPSGSKYLPTYQEQIEDGVKSLVKTGERDIDELIQMDFESTKIENILHNALMGDLAALNAREGTYCDATTMPKTLQEAQNLVLKAKEEFDKFPIEVKNKFNNSADKYVELMGTEEFNNIMAPYNEEIAKISMEKSHKEYLKKVKDGAQLNYDIAKAQEELKQRGEKEGGTN